jgi:ATP-dependent HslUV protease subunit HslV
VKPLIRSTTVLAVRRGGSVVMAGDGQVSMGNTIIKHGARKVRFLHDNRVLAGFAGSTADAVTLFEKFEGKLKDHGGNLTRAAVELAKDWLEALLLVADRQKTFLLSGTGDVIEPDGAVTAIGSGGPFAMAAATALVESSDLPARRIAEEAMRIAGRICIYTNDQIVIEELQAS